MNKVGRPTAREHLHARGVTDPGECRSVLAAVLEACPHQSVTVAIMDAAIERVRNGRSA